MNKFDNNYKQILESLTEELNPETSFEHLLGVDIIKTYHSSERPNDLKFDSGLHVGSKQQALIRADYKINDAGTHYKYYLYELVIKLGNVWPILEEDNGENHKKDYYSEMVDKFDSVIYKNTGEGNIKNNNLSIVILKPENVISFKRVKELTGSYLNSIQNELYRT